MKAALVAGSTGFIGLALTRRLSEEGIQTFCLVREKQHIPASFKELRGAEVIEIRSSHTDTLQKALSGITADVVFNLASYGVNPKENNPDIMIDANLHFVSRLLHTTSQWPLSRFIHAGSCFEYGEPDDLKPIKEDHPIRPMSLYGATKAASVIIGNALAGKFSTPFVTLRLFGVYGKGERPHRLIPYIMNRLKNDEPVDLTQGAQVRDLIYIDDVVDAFITAARHEAIMSRSIYNICTGIPVTIREVGETVARIMDKPSSLLHWGERTYTAGEPMWLLGDGRKFEEATGWRPKIGLHDGISQMKPSDA